MAYQLNGLPSMVAIWSLLKLLSSVYPVRHTQPPACTTINQYVFIEMHDHIFGLQNCHRFHEIYVKKISMPSSESFSKLNNLNYKWIVIWFIYFNLKETRIKYEWTMLISGVMTYSYFLNVLHTFIVQCLGLYKISRNFKEPNEGTIRKVYENLHLYMFQRRNYPLPCRPCNAGGRRFRGFQT